MFYFPFSVRRFCFRCLLFTLDDDYLLSYVLLSVLVSGFVLLVSAVLCFRCLPFVLDDDYSLSCALLSSFGARRFFRVLRVLFRMSLLWLR